MDINELLTDQERIALTEKAYQELQIGDHVTINDKLIGVVTESIYEKDGFRAFVIVNQNEATVLFKGSYGFIKGNPTTWRDEWLNTNLPILVSLLTHTDEIPSQLKTAARQLNRIISHYRFLHIYLYGHSLGAINAQYALANCRSSYRIKKAYLYEGTNIWTLLNQKQRQKVEKMRNKIFNYVDIYDPVTLGLTASHHMVGKLQYIDSVPISPIKQHLFGGYQFDKNGRVRLKEVDDAFLTESMNQYKLLSKSGSLAKALEKMGQTKVIRNWAKAKLTELQKRFPDHKSLEKLNDLTSDQNKDHFSKSV